MPIDPMTAMMLAQMAQKRMSDMFGQNKGETAGAAPIPQPMAPQPVGQAQAPMSYGQQIRQGAVNGAMGGLMMGQSPIMGALLGAGVPAIQGGINKLRGKGQMNTDVSAMPNYFQKNFGNPDFSKFL